MGDNEKIRRYKVIETQWELTEGLQAIGWWNMKRKQKKENKLLRSNHAFGDLWMTTENW